MQVQLWALSVTTAAMHPQSMHGPEVTDERTLTSFMQPSKSVSMDRTSAPLAMGCTSNPVTHQHLVSGSKVTHRCRPVHILAEHTTAGCCSAQKQREGQHTHMTGNVSMPDTTSVCQVGTCPVLEAPPGCLYSQL